MTDPNEHDDGIIWAVTYDETSQQFEERIIEVIDARMREAKSD